MPKSKYKYPGKTGIIVDDCEITFASLGDWLEATPEQIFGVMEDKPIESLIKINKFPDRVETIIPMIMIGDFRWFPKTIAYTLSGARYNMVKIGVENSHFMSKEKVDQIFKQSPELRMCNNVFPVCCRTTGNYHILELLIKVKSALRQFQFDHNLVRQR